MPPVFNTEVPAERTRAAVTRSISFARWSPVDPSVRIGIVMPSEESVVQFSAPGSEPTSTTAEAHRLRRRDNRQHGGAGSRE